MFKEIKDGELVFGLYRDRKYMDPDSNQILFVAIANRNKWHSYPNYMHVYILRDFTIDRGGYIYDEHEKFLIACDDPILQDVKLPVRTECDIPF
jgi:hypothetical protein